MNWYPHYPGDYTRDTAHLSLVQHGAYRLLLDHYYSTASPLPSEASTLYRICRAFDEGERNAVDFVISQFFELRADGHHNSRADRQLVIQDEQHRRLSEGARKTNAKRWGTPSPSESPSESPSGRISKAKAKAKYQREEKTLSAASPPVSVNLPVADGFEQFWTTYPKKVAKDAAYRAWRKVKPEEVDAILARLELNKIGEWVGKEKQYIPNPATWLNGRRWTDEIISGVNSGKPTLGDALETTLASHVRFEQDKPN
jgi:uncharacterized protein YdaU (DUF1376 family)